MTFTNDAWAVDGSTASAVIARLQLKSSTRGNQGIMTAGALRVQALSTPGPSVTVADGDCVVLGQEVQWQGTYYGYNIGNTTVSITPTTGTSRSDLIVVRMQDPTFSGSPWTGNPSTDVLMDVHVIQGVSPSATTAPSGSSAIALARIDIPASTSAITQAMIVDLRNVANPRRDRGLDTHSPSAIETLTGTTWKNFPTTAHWPVTIPSWATQVKVVVTAAGVHLSSGQAYGSFRFQLGTLFGQAVNLDDDQTGTRRNTLIVADTLSVPAVLRGTTQTLQVQMIINSGNASTITTDTATTFVADVEFNEVATYDL